MKHLIPLFVLLCGFAVAALPDRPKRSPTPALTQPLQQPCTVEQDREQLLQIVGGEDIVLLDELALLEELGDLHNPAVDEIVDRHAKEQIERVRALTRLKRDYAERHPEVVGK